VASAAVAVVPPPATRGRPRISGLAVAGRLLTESHASWSNAPTSITYQWQRCRVAGGGCHAIAGATAPTYRLTAADVGSTIVVAERAANASGAGSPASSNPTALIQPIAPKTVLTAARIDASAASATFRLRAVGVATGFRCALVRGGRAAGPPRYAACGASATFRNLKHGRYVLYVRAVAPGGADGAPATYRFTV
jgi:predicted phage tail protein